MASESRFSLGASGRRANVGTVNGRYSIGHHEDREGEAASWEHPHGTVHSQMLEDVLCGSRSQPELHGKQSVYATGGGDVYVCQWSMTMSSHLYTARSDVAGPPFGPINCLAPAPQIAPPDPHAPPRLGHRWNSRTTRLHVRRHRQNGATLSPTLHKKFVLFFYRFIVSLH